MVYVALTGGTAPRPGSLALENLKYDGRLLSWSTFATAIICGLAIVIVVKLKRGSKLSDYLGLIFPNLRQLFFWLVVLIAFNGISDGISVLLGKPTTPEFMVKAYSSLAPPWILWLALLVAAPLFEELFFRGFLIKGLSASVTALVRCGDYLLGNVGGNSHSVRSLRHGHHTCPRIHSRHSQDQKRLNYSDDVVACVYESGGDR